MQERSAINVAHGLKKEGKEEEVEKKEEGVRDVEDVQDGDGKMHINIGLVVGLNISFLCSKLITYRSFFRYMQGRIYARAKGAWAQGGKFPGASY
jgi:hypothetical protein